MHPPTGDPVVHLELHTPDGQGAGALLGALCGWRPEHLATSHGAYTALAMGRRLGGGIVECETQRPVWLPYVEVADVVAAPERARSLGATVLLDAREGPAGWRTVVASDTGGEIAFWQPKR